jgi:regulator of sirC expression with transglutaminase-like and TPR domain
VTGPSPRERFGELVRREQVPLAQCCVLLADAVARAAGLPTRPDGMGSCGDALDRLAAGMPQQGPADERLRRALQGFGGDAADYDDLRSSLLPDVLRRRRGLPILLSVVWLEVAARADVPAYGIGLPGHFVVGIGDPDGHQVVVDPFHRGRTLRPVDLRRLAGAAGGELPAGSLRPWEPVEVLQRVLGNVVAWADARQRWQVELATVEYALLLPRHSLDLRRRHADLMARLGGFAEAATGLEDYADVVAHVDPDEADRARLEARRLRARLN